MSRDYQAPFALPAGATELILVRHGAAVWSAADTPIDAVHRQADAPLSALGHEQACRLPGRFGAGPVEALFVSPLRRATETAAALAESLALVPVVLDELREVHLGAWEAQGGIRHDLPEQAEITARLFAEETWAVIPGAEAAESFAARVAAVLSQLADQTGPDRVGLAVTHGGVIAEACHQVTGSRPFAFFATENGSLTRLIRSPGGGWSLQSFNDIAHLQPPAPHELAVVSVVHPGERP